MIFADVLVVKAFVKLNLSRKRVDLRIEGTFSVSLLNELLHIVVFPNHWLITEPIRFILKTLLVSLSLHHQRGKLVDFGDEIKLFLLFISSTAIYCFGIFSEQFWRIFVVLIYGRRKRSLLFLNCLYFLPFFLFSVFWFRKLF